LSLNWSWSRKASFGCLEEHNPPTLVSEGAKKLLKVLSVGVIEWLMQEEAPSPYAGSECLQDASHSRRWPLLLCGPSGRLNNRQQQPSHELG